MRLPRTGAALLLLGLLACPARPPETRPDEAEDAPQPEGVEAGSPRHPDDDPLPAPEEIPSFLAPRLPPREGMAEEAHAPAAPGAHDTEWDAHAGLGFLSVRPGESRYPEDPPTEDTHEAPASAGAMGEASRARQDAPRAEETGAHDFPEGDARDAEPEFLSLRPGESRDPADPPTDEPPVSAEAPGPCQDLRDAIARHQAYLHRIHDERRAFGWVEDHEDGAALRLLEGLRRCEAHPEDPDCLPPPLVADLGDRTLESHEFSRDPSDLEAEGREPDEIPHDPRMLDLLEKLRRCEAAQAPRSPFPLPGP